MPSLGAPPSEKQIFLSHSGLDRDLALDVAARLTQRLAECGYQVRVFNTSAPEHRYQELQEMLSAGEAWASRAKQYEDELRDYLRAQLEQSLAFVSLITRRSHSAGSDYITFEMDTAHTLARDGAHAGAGFFFPLLAGDADYQDLGDTKAETFQAVKLEGRGFDDLVEALCASLDGRR